jgi:hypothetical protein
MGKCSIMEKGFKMNMSIYVEYVYDFNLYSAVFGDGRGAEIGCNHIG